MRRTLNQMIVSPAKTAGRHVAENDQVRLRHQSRYDQHHLRSRRSVSRAGHDYGHLRGSASDSGYGRGSTPPQRSLMSLGRYERGMARILKPSSR